MRVYRESLKNTSFYAILFWEAIFPHRIREKFYAVFKYLAACLGVAVALSYSGLFSPPVSGIIPGLFLVSFAVFLIFALFRAYYFSYYGGREGEILSGNIIFTAFDGDLVSSFLRSPAGRLFILRSEISGIEVDKFLSERVWNKGEGLAIPPSSRGGELLDIRELVSFIISSDAEFSTFLSGHSIDKGTADKIMEWVLGDMEKDHRRELWWSRDYLSKIRGIGKDWAFGGLFYLIKYGRDLAKEVAVPVAGYDVKEFKDEVRELEAVLSKDRQGNAILVGEAGAGVMDMVFEFVRRLRRGKVAPKIEYKKAFLLDWNGLISVNKTKTNFESEFIKILDEAAYAGNIILVIDDLPGFVLSAQALGSNISGVMKPYLESSFRVIATASPSRFHAFVETDADLVSAFDKIQIEETDEDKTIKIIENTARKTEKKTGIFFSYPAISEIVKSAAQYIPGAVMPDGAIDMFFEMTASLTRSGTIVRRADVLDFVEMKTKIPVGKIEAGEKEKLLHLEALLHDRVVGQEEAVSAVSNAMRRARANIRNAKKPIGTFLFFGPTGVGKTETAKALAQVFFGDEKYLLRLDMTEYQKADSLPRLIGSFDAGKPGILSSLLRENPYGVLLLDEFEKAEKDVLNLFLQILDEGFFSDMNGKKVSLRNVIIVATSNAASDYIYELFKKGEDVAGRKDDIIMKIVESGTFKPELMNRFDAAVIFRPLVPGELAEIAMMMLQKLKKRLAEKGIEFIFGEDLAMTVSKLGSDEAFGARPMQRFIQDKIEEPIARRIISGEVKSGGRIEFRTEDLARQPK